MELKNTLIAVFFLMACAPAFSQVFSNKEVGKKNEALSDSLKNSEYPYSLPIWGKKATKAGYNLPYSAGVSAQLFWSVSDILIDNLEVGFNNGPMYNLDGIVRFDKARATVSAVTVRPDIWLFPFLNVYGIFGKAQASTEVGFGIWIPDSTNTYNEVTHAESLVEFNATTFGLGITPTIGVGGGFLALDMNFSWTDVPQLKDPAFTFVFGPRLGKNFKLKKPDRSVAIWVGGFRVKIKSGTEGSINLNEALSAPEMGSKVDNGIIKVGEAQQEVDVWWSNLTAMEQNNPVNIAKYEASNAALEKAGQILNQADAAINNVQNSSVQYSMDKSVKDKWTFIVGSQFQFNKHWMARGEFGFLSSRTQFLIGMQYRFGL